MTDNPVVYIELIEDQPLTIDGWSAKHSIPPDYSPERIQAGYESYRTNFQPWHWRARSEGNNEILSHGERYFNEADAIHNIELQYGWGATIYLRRGGYHHELSDGHQLVRDAYPKQYGDVISIGPECFAAADGSVLNWQGTNYIPAPPEG